MARRSLCLGRPAQQLGKLPRQSSLYRCIVVSLYQERCIRKMNVGLRGLDERLTALGMARVTEYPYQVGNCLFDTIAYAAENVLSQQLDAHAVRVRAMNMLEQAYAEYSADGASTHFIKE